MAASAGPAVFRMPLENPGTLRFIVAGDAGTGDPHLHHGVTALARQMPIDGILLVGDNVYPCGVTAVDDPQWHKVTKNFADAGVPIYPVLGNHDYGDPDGDERCNGASPAAQVRATGRVPRWTFPARHYTLESPLASIVLFDSEPVAADFREPFLGSETARREAAWLDAALGGAHGTWRIVAGHHPVYSSGAHFGSRGQKRMLATILPILERQKVDLYISGHDHDAELVGGTAERPFYLIAGNGAHSDAIHRRTRAGEPKTIFPTTFPPKPLVGFTLLEIAPRSLSITFYDGLGEKKSETYVVRR